jgi:hypothetical protein
MCPLCAVRHRPFYTSRCNSAQAKVFGPALCAGDLIRAAELIFLLNLMELTARLKTVKA